MTEGFAIWSFPGGEGGDEADFAHGVAELGEVGETVPLDAQIANKEAFAWLTAVPAARLTSRCNFLRVKPASIRFWMFVVASFPR